MSVARATTSHEFCLSRSSRISKGVRHMKFRGSFALVVTLILAGACATDDSPPAPADDTVQPVGPRSGEVEVPLPPQGPKSVQCEANMRDQGEVLAPLAEPQASTCISSGSCQLSGVHCCTGIHIPTGSCQVPGFSGYECVSCIPNGYCQPAGTHCCSGNHYWLPGVCGGTGWSGYMCGFKAI
jgi:hypothetical protein